MYNNVRCLSVHSCDKISFNRQNSDFLQIGLLPSLKHGGVLWPSHRALDSEARGCRYKLCWGALCCVFYQLRHFQQRYGSHYENLPMQYTENFFSFKKVKISLEKF